jgi:hypothetical protein
LKSALRKWLFRFAATGVFILMLLLVIVLNPGLSYAHHTNYGRFNIYHHNNLEASFTIHLTAAEELLSSSVLYKERLQLDICLNDGSVYPAIVEKLTGPAFARGFYNKVVLHGSLNTQENYIELNGYKWNLTQLLAHEMVHCLQFEQLGLLHSKPIASIPNWKWEGYAEYIARNTADMPTLVTHISTFIEAPGSNWAITLNNNTIIPKQYFEYWLMVRFCLDEQQMSYDELLNDTKSAITVYNEMMEWYKKHSSNNSKK